MWDPPSSQTQTVKINFPRAEKSDEKICDIFTMQSLRVQQKLTGRACTTAQRRPNQMPERFFFSFSPSLNVPHPQFLAVATFEAPHYHPQSHKNCSQVKELSNSVIILVVFF